MANDSDSIYALPEPLPPGCEGLDDAARAQIAGKIADMRAQWDEEISTISAWIAEQEADHSQQAERLEQIASQAQRLHEATAQAMDFASDMMQQLGWARSQSAELAQELDQQERDAYRLFDTCWDALDMNPNKRRVQ